MNKEIKPGYIKTAIGIIPEGWEVKKFEDVFEQLRTYTFSRNELGYEKKGDCLYNIHYGDIHAAFPKNILDVKKDLSLIPIIIDPEIEDPALLKEGDLIMADASEDYEGVGQSIELVNVGKRRIISGTHTFALRAKTEFAPKYSGYIFSAFQAHRELKKIATGISVYGLSKTNISKINIPIPPLDEQKSIANCLSTWDSGIEKLTQLIQAKKLQKQGLMQQLLTGTHRLRSASGEKFDEKWKEVRLGEIGKVEYGTRIVKDRTEPGNYFVYGGGGKTFTTKNFNRENNMIIARFAMSPECARFVKGKFFLNDSGLTVKSKRDIFQMFLDYLLFHFKYKIYALRAGGAQQNLDVSALKKIKLKLPSYDEQTAIANILQISDKEIELLEQKLFSLQKQKKGLMQVLLTGEKRLNYDLVD